MKEITEDFVNENGEETRMKVRIKYKVHCAKHGSHEHVIRSDIKGYEGCWCQLCWIESLGTSQPYSRELITQKIPSKPEEDH